MSKRILITGGAGFIGSHMVRLMVNKYPEYTIVNFDKLTYAGNLDNLKDIEDKSNYHFFKGDICSEIDVQSAFEKHDITDVIHLAAESHVDRSIEGYNGVCENKCARISELDADCQNVLETE